MKMADLRAQVKARLMVPLEKMSWRRLLRKLRNQFLTGIFLTVPIGIVILILVWLFVSIDNILEPVVKAIFGYKIPGVGFAFTLLLIYLIGLFASNFIGKRLIIYSEAALSKVPVVGQLYSGIKQILESFRGSRDSGFMRVVLVEFPRKGMRTIGFITNETTDSSGRKLLNIFIPTAPNPTSGFLQIAREEDVIRTDISVDDAVKMVISAGKVSPKEIDDKLASKD